MADEQHMPLSYPNPSFSQMACLEDQGTQGGGLDKPVAEVGAPPVRGIRQAVLMASLLVGLLFSTLDTSIVSTSMMTISHELSDFANAPWIVLAYLLTYMGFAVCISKLSDIYGRRNMLVLSWILFMGFSLGCASAKDMMALIVLLRVPGHRRVGALHAHADRARRDRARASAEPHRRCHRRDAGRGLCARAAPGRRRLAALGLALALQHEHPVRPGDHPGHHQPVAARGRGPPALVAGPFAHRRARQRRPRLRLGLPRLRHPAGRLAGVGLGQPRDRGRLCVRGPQLGRLRRLGGLPREQALPARGVDIPHGPHGPTRLRRRSGAHAAHGLSLHLPLRHHPRAFPDGRRPGRPHGRRPHPPPAGGLRRRLVPRRRPLEPAQQHVVHARRRLVPRAARRRPHDDALGRPGRRPGPLRIPGRLRPRRRPLLLGRHHHDQRAGPGAGRPRLGPRRRRPGPRPRRLRRPLPLHGPLQRARQPPARRRPDARPARHAAPLAPGGPAAAPAPVRAGQGRLRRRLRAADAGHGPRVRRHGGRLPLHPREAPGPDGRQGPGRGRGQGQGVAAARERLGDRHQHHLEHPAGRLGGVARAPPARTVPLIKDYMKWTCVCVRRRRRPGVCQTGDRPVDALCFCCLGPFSLGWTLFWTARCISQTTQDLDHLAACK